MKELKTTLCTLRGFIDNEYLAKYISLIERNTRTKKTPRVTNKHHIIPKVWFKLNGLPIDNNESNLVNLAYREHVLAHYYLCLCTEDKLKFANELALICLVSRKKLNAVDKQLIQHLPLYNSIYEDYKIRTKNYEKI